jgi:hypothetical protein
MDIVSVRKVATGKRATGIHLMAAAESEKQELRALIEQAASATSIEPWRCAVVQPPGVFP